jgi:hypothetical protein
MVSCLLGPLHAATQMSCSGILAGMQPSLGAPSSPRCAAPLIGLHLSGSCSRACEATLDPACAATAVCSMRMIFRRSRRMPAQHPAMDRLSRCVQMQRASCACQATCIVCQDTWERTCHPECINPDLLLNRSELQCCNMRNLCW